MLTPSMLQQLSKIAEPRMTPLVFGVVIVLVLQVFHWAPVQLNGDWQAYIEALTIIAISLVYSLAINRYYASQNGQATGCNAASDENVLETWGGFDEALARVMHDIKNDGFKPDLVVFLGRSGAIFGGAIAGNLRVVKTAMLDRDIESSGNTVTKDDISHTIPHDYINGKSVLIVKGEVSSGNSMRRAMELLKSLGAAEVRLAAYYVSHGSKLAIQYVGFRGDKVAIPTPWRNPALWPRRALPALS